MIVPWFPLSFLSFVVLQLGCDTVTKRPAVKNGGFVVRMDVDDFELILLQMPKLEVVSAD